MTEVVVYLPPKGSGFGQAFRFKRVRPAFAALQHFLSTCTSSPTLVRVTLRAYEATEWDDDEVAEEVIDRTIKHFGPPKERDQLGTRWPSGEPLKGGILSWPFTPDDIPRVVEFLAHNEPWPKQTLGPVELHFSVTFKWRDPDSGLLLPNQNSGHGTSDGQLHSNCLVTLGRKQFIQPEFWFPFPEGSPDLERFLASIGPLLPFKLNPRHFRCASRRGTSTEYNFRKLVHPPGAV